MSIKIQLNSLEALESLFKCGAEGKEIEFAVKERIFHEFAKKHIKGMFDGNMESNLRNMVDAEIKKNIVDWSSKDRRYEIKDAKVKDAMEQYKNDVKAYVDDNAKKMKGEIEKAIQPSLDMVKNQLKKEMEARMDVISRDMMKQIIEEFSVEKVKERAIELLNEAYYMGMGIDITEKKNDKKST